MGEAQRIVTQSHQFCPELVSVLAHGILGVVPSAPSGTFLGIHIEWRKKRPMVKMNSVRMGKWAWSALAGVGIALAALVLQEPLVGLAKEFSISGTVDCNRRSGQSCSYEG